MTLEGASKNLCALDPEIHPTVLDSGNGSLRNAGEFGQLALAQLLEFTQDTEGLADRNLNSFFGKAIAFHLRASGNRGR